MKQLLTVVLCAAVLLIAGTAGVRAQDAEPTPPADPHHYSDQAMNFQAPADAVMLGMHAPDLAQLSSTELQMVALWALHFGHEDTRAIQIEMESFNGTPDQWEGVFESQIHGSRDGVLVRGKTTYVLTNGMPAYFVEVAYGAGFQARKQYSVLWADGQRGVALSLIGRVGDVSADEAKKVLHDASAVRYPTDQP